MAYPTTFLDAQNEVIAKVRLHASNDLSKVKDWLNQTYADTCVETEALQDYAEMTLTSGQNVYELDDQILRIKQMYVTPSGQGPSRPLEPMSLEKILAWSASNGATPSNGGSVTHYALVGVNLIHFYPTPASADTVTVYYVKAPPPLVDDTDVPVIPEPYITECLTNGACYKAAIFLKDPDAPTFKQDYELAKRNLRGHLRRKAGAMTKQFNITRGGNLTPHDPSTDIR